MADSEQLPVKPHPIAPRVKQHHKKSHVGPDIQAYRDHHSKTVGEGSDEWWAKVHPPPSTYACPHCLIRRSLSLHLQVARETLHWDRPFKTVRAGSFENGDIVWFPEGALNASYNCVDRWVYTQPDKVGTDHLFLFLSLSW